MPRRKGRYSKLLASLRESGVPSAGTTGEEKRLQGFYKYIIGDSKIEQNNKIPAEARKLFKIGLIPFAVSAASTAVTERYIAYMSAYSLKGLKDRTPNTLEAQLGIFKEEGGEIENSNYYPALIRASFSTTSAGVVEKKVSAVTKQAYRYDYKRTFSFPFGRSAVVEDAETGTAETTVANVDEIDVFRFVANNLKANTTAANVPTSISYEPEVFKTRATGTGYRADTNPGSFPTS